MIYELSETFGLSNGDKVTLIWELDNEMASEYTNATLKGSEVTVTVKDLEEAETFDAFEYVEVLYSGMSLAGTATVANNAPSDSKAALLNFTMDKSSALQNGDTITVTVNNSDNAEYMIETFGALPETASKKYTVDGLAAYAAKLADIPDDLYSEMEQQGKDEISAYIAGNWDDPSKLHGIEMIGNYFLTPKTTLNSNYLDYVYKIYYEDMTTGEETNFYWYVGFSDIIIMPDGTGSVDLTSTTVPSGSSFFGSISGEAFSRDGYFFIGYENFATLFNNEVTQFVADYNYESTVVEN